MKTVEVSSKYTYEYEGQYITFFIGKIEGAPLVEVYNGANMVYYKPLTSEETSTNEDLELVQKIVKSMQNSKPRWYEPKICQWIVDNFNEMNYKERVTTYEFIINDRVQKVFVSENYKNHAKVHLVNDEDKDKLSIDLDVKEGDNILRACAEYVDVLNVVLKAFKENASEIPQATLLKKMFTE